MKNEDIEDIIEKLQEYVNLDGSETGAVADLLIGLYEGHYDYVGPTFIKALEKELRAQLKNFQKYSIIVEKEEIKTETVKTKTLEWY